jgi:hypothetical protein
LRITVFVTCLCVPEDVPDIPGMEVRVGGRPDMGVLVRGVMGGGGGVVVEDGDGEEGSEEGGKENENGNMVKENEKGDMEGGGERKRERRSEGCLGVCASGPASLTREVSNAVARLAGTRVGGKIGLHTEVFAV